MELLNNFNGLSLVVIMILSYFAVLKALSAIHSRKSKQRSIATIAKKKFSSRN